jgi:hypothetical protein
VRSDELAAGEGRTDGSEGGIAAPAHTPQRHVMELRLDGTEVTDDRGRRAERIAYEALREEPVSREGRLHDVFRCTGTS